MPPIEIRAAPPLAPAAYRRAPAPSYPALAREQGLEGEVVLTVLVGADGRVVDVHVKASSGAPVLDEAAVGAVRQWTARGGEPGRGPDAVRAHPEMIAGVLALLLLLLAVPPVAAQQPEVPTRAPRLVRGGVRLSF